MEQKGLDLFGIEMPDVKPIIQNTLKPIKEKKRKGEITIGLLNSPENPYDVSFNGFQEGSGSPCKDEIEVNACVKRLVEEHKEKYNLKIIDKREEQKKEIEKKKQDKVKVILNEDYTYDSNYQLEEYWAIEFENYGYLGSVGSSACKGRTMEDVWKEYYDKMLKEGYLPENIEVIKSPRTEEKKQRELKTIAERKEYYRKFDEKEIEQTSKKLKELLKKKYGFDVKIQILKDETKLM